MYYSGNRFLTMQEMEVNANYIYEYLTAIGWSKNAICGILGNMQTESTINPAIWEGLVEGDTDRGFGLVQWTPATKYSNWCTPLNLTPEAMDSNLLRILYEVENDIQWGNDSLGNPPPYTFQEFTISTNSAYNLAMEFLLHYERPLNPDQPNRGTQAEYWYELLVPPKKKHIKPYMLLTKKRRIFYT